MPWETKIIKWDINIHCSCYTVSYRIQCSKELPNALPQRDLMVRVQRSITPQSLSTPLSPLPALILLLQGKAPTESCKNTDTLSYNTLFVGNTAPLIKTDCSDLSKIIMVRAVMVTYFSCFCPCPTPQMSHIWCKVAIRSSFVPLHVKASNNFLIFFHFF